MSLPCSYLAGGPFCSILRYDRERSLTSFAGGLRFTRIEWHTQRSSEVTLVMIEFAFSTGVGATLILLAILWAMLSGSLISPLWIDLQQIRTTTKRSVNDEATNDDIITLVKLRKGRWSAITLRELKVELFKLDRATYKQLSIGDRPSSRFWKPSPDNRSLNAKGERICERYVLAFWTPEKGRSLNLPPGEQTQFASYCVVPTQIVCETIITIVGERYKAKGPRRCLVSICRNVTKRLPSSKRVLGPTRKWLTRNFLNPVVVYYAASTISATASPISRQPQIAPQIL